MLVSKQYSTPLSTATASVIYRVPKGPSATSTSSPIGFIQLSENDIFWSDTQLWANHNLVLTANNSFNCAENFLVNSSGSNSAIAYFVHNLIQNRNLTNRFSKTLTGQLLDYLSYFRVSNDLNDIANDSRLGLGNAGVIAVKKIIYGENIKPNSFTASSSASLDLQFVDSISADEDWGIVVRKSDGLSAGIIFYDLGIVLIHGPSISAVQAITAITNIKLSSTYKIWKLSTFCTAHPEQLNYSWNASAFYNKGMTGEPLFNKTLTGFSTYGYNWGSSDISETADKSNYFLSELGTNWGPYYTTIGLYNDENELLAIAKLSQPIKKPKNFPITFRVDIDFD